MLNRSDWEKLETKVNEVGKKIYNLERRRSELSERRNDISDSHSASKRSLTSMLSTRASKAEMKEEIERLIDKLRSKIYIVTFDLSIDKMLILTGEKSSSKDGQKLLGEKLTLTSQLRGLIDRRNSLVSELKVVSYGISEMEQMSNNYKKQLAKIDDELKGLVRKINSLSRHKDKELLKKLKVVGRMELNDGELIDIMHIQYHINSKDVSYHVQHFFVDKHTKQWFILKEGKLTEKVYDKQVPDHKVAELKKLLANEAVR